MSTADSWQLLQRRQGCNKHMYISILLNECCKSAQVATGILEVTVITILVSVARRLLL
jgi:hypothetical protein